VASHRFTSEEADWGFSRLYDIRKLAYKHEDRDRPIVEGGETMISAYVKIVKDPTGVLWHNFNKYEILLFRQGLTVAMTRKRRPVMLDSKTRERHAT
jgi:ubiquitin carboxyl-terminal hydrolase 7